MNTERDGHWGWKTQPKAVLRSHVSFSPVESLGSWLCQICHVGTTFLCCSLVFQAHPEPGVAGGGLEGLCVQAEDP